MPDDLDDEGAFKARLKKSAGIGFLTTIGIAFFGGMILMLYGVDDDSWVSLAGAAVAVFAGGVVADVRQIRHLDRALWGHAQSKYGGSSATLTHEPRQRLTAPHPSAVSGRYLTTHWALPFLLCALPARSLA